MTLNNIYLFIVLLIPWVGWQALLISEAPLRLDGELTSCTCLAVGLVGVSLDHGDDLVTCFSSASQLPSVFHMVVVSGSPRRASEQVPKARFFEAFVCGVG